MKQFLVSTILLLSLAPYGCKISGQKIKKDDVFVAAYYFPNYHTGDERHSKNPDKGPEWSEWELVKEAKPRFENHEQPKVPMWGYLDEKDPKVMELKINTAVEHGIDCFIFDWYMYEDGPFLNKCIDEGFLQAENTNKIKFALMWANHDWKNIHPHQRGTPVQLLYPGIVSPDRFDAICDHVIEKYFKQQNYWKIDNKPYFSIYDIKRFVNGFDNVNEAKKALIKFDSKAKKAGFDGIHLNIVAWGSPILPGEEAPMNLTEIVNTFGFTSATSYVWIHHVPINVPKDIDFLHVFNSYLKYWDQKTTEYTIPYIPNVTMGWDSSPRTVQSYDWNGTWGYPYTGIIVNNTPENFKAALAKIKEKILENPNTPNIVTINCWNEWTEGSYLEPDTKYGLKYLEAIQSVFGN